ncbi:MAG: SRPBCC family protein [Acidimicrobiia bacterium]
MADTFTVERATTIQAPAAAIYPLISDFHKWSEWSPWDELDPDMQRSFSGAESGAGAKYAWSGNRKAGQGTMEMTEAMEPSKVAIDLNFVKPFKSSNTTTFRLSEEGDSTLVTWTMVGPQTMMTKVMGIFRSMDKMIGPDFEKGLAKLKTVSES